MKKMLFILFVLANLTVTIAQVKKITIKKEKPRQDQMASTVTLAGLYNGNCSVATILMEKQLKISNNTSGFKIISFVAWLTNRGIVKFYGNAKDSLSNDFQTELLNLNLSTKPKLYIDEIKAINSNKDTVLLNPIILTLTP